MSNFHSVHWFMQQQEKKKEAQEGRDVHLINRQLQQVLHEIESYVDKSTYQREANLVNRHLVQSSVWRITYVNNMENKQVALEQALFILTILSKEELERKTIWEREVDNQMRRLGDVDWGLYLTYGSRKRQIHRK